MRHARLPRWLVGGIVICAAWLGCGALQAAQDKMALPVGPAAVVNGQPITRDELALAVLRLQGQQSAGRPDASAAALEQLIDQRLLAQAALRAGLKSWPDTQAVMARTRRQILRTAYLQERLRSLPQPSGTQVEQFIAARPQFFKDRKTYHFTRVFIAWPQDEAVARFQAAQRVHADLPSLLDHLTDNKVEFRVENLWQASEQIFPDQLAVLDALHDGQMQFMAPAKGSFGVLIQRKSAFADPKPYEQLRGPVAMGLMLQSAEAASSALLVDLRLKARIVFPEITRPQASTVAAWINGEAIALAEVEDVVNPDGRGARIVSDTSRKKVLENLIADTLAAQQALASGLDKLPDVAQALEQVERQVLAARFLNLEFSRLENPPLVRAQLLASQRPDLFAQRKVYRFDEILIRGQAAQQLASIQQAIDPSWDTTTVRQALQKLGWEHSVSSIWRSTEQIAESYRLALSGAADGSNVVLASPDGSVWVVLHKIAQYADPLSTQAAIDMATQMLGDAAKSQASRALIQRLRSEGKISLAPDLVAASTLQAPSGFLLSALNKSQRLAWGLLVVQMLVLGGGSLGLLRLRRYHRGRLSGRSGSDIHSSDKARSGLHAFQKMGRWGLYGVMGVLVVLLVLPLKGAVQAAALPRESLALALALGLMLWLLVGALAWYARQQHSERVSSPIRHWTLLLGVLAVQVLLFLMVEYGF